METKWDISDSCNGGRYNTIGLALLQFLFMSDLAPHDRLGMGRHGLRFSFNAFLRKISFYIWVAFVL